MKRKYSTLFSVLAVLILILSACNLPSSPAATSTPPPAATQPLSVTLPAGSFPTLAPTTVMTSTEPPLIPDCASPNGFMGQVCMAKNAAGETLNPRMTVGCIVNGQNVGTASPYGMNAGEPIKDYLQCDAPLYAEAFVFEVQAGTTARFGPGSYRSKEVPPQIWFDVDNWGVPNNAKVKVHGCYQDHSGYAQLTLPQYETAGSGRVEATNINYRVLVETAEGWFTWVWGGSLDGTTDGILDVTQFNAVCNPYSATAASAPSPTATNVTP